MQPCVDPTAGGPHHTAALGVSLHDLQADGTLRSLRHHKLGLRHLLAGTVRLTEGPENTKHLQHSTSNHLSENLLEVSEEVVHGAPLHATRKVENFLTAPLYTNHCGSWLQTVAANL